MEVWTVYQHKVTKERIAYPGVRVTAHVRAMSRRRRRILQAVMEKQFSSFLTFTYDDKLIPKCYKDVFEFHSSSQVAYCLNRIRAYFYKYDIPKFSYIWVCEYGELRGRPHWHVLTTIPYTLSILHGKLEQWWGYGFVKVVQLHNNYHVGKYVAKYMVKQDQGQVMRRYGTSQDIPGTPKSVWRRVMVVLEERLEEVVQDWNYWLTKGELDQYIEVSV